MSNNNVTNGKPHRIDAAHGHDTDRNNGSTQTLGPLAPPPSPEVRAKMVTLRAPSSVDQSSGSDRSDARASSSDASRFLRASLADALSSSLATIAGANRRGARAPNNNRGGESSSSSSSGLRRESSISSSGRYGGESGGAAVVTASTQNTTSSGDDRYTSGGNSGSNTSGDTGTSSLPYAHAETVEDTGPFLRHYQRRRLVPDRLQARDGYGLPVHVDERLDRRTAHAVVVARLPPPHTETGSSSFFSSSSDKGGSGGEDRGSGNDEGQGSMRVLPAHYGIAMGHLPESNSMGQALTHHHARNRSAETEHQKPAAVDVTKLKEWDSKLPNQRAVLPPVSDPSLTKRLGLKRQLSIGNGSCSLDSFNSGSGSEAGYAGSASSSDNASQQSSCSSSSTSSSEGSLKRKRGLTTSHRRGLRKRSGVSSLSEVADSNPALSRDAGGVAEGSISFCLASRSCSPVSSAFSTSSKEDGSSDELDEDRPDAALGVARRHDPQEGSTGSQLPEETVAKAAASRKRPPVGSEVSRASKRSRTCTDPSPLLSFQSKLFRATKRTSQAALKLDTTKPSQHKILARTASANLKSCKAGLIYGKAPIFSMGCDTMALCLSYLEPLEVHYLLTVPLSKDWHTLYTQPHELWRVLCLSEPFKAKFDVEENDSSDESLYSFPVHAEVEIKHLFGRYRLLYTSFVRCMRYLSRIKEDAVSGRPPSMVDYGGAGVSHRPFTSNTSLKNFLAKARGIVVKNKRQREEESPLSSCSSSTDDIPEAPLGVAAAAPVGVSDSDTCSVQKQKKVAAKAKPNKVKYAPSALTQRLLGPARTGEAGDVNLPWSCAIYSIVNWMVAFADVEGIQTMCLKVLPFLLEDENQRTTAQRAGLTGIVLRGMVLFPDSVELHTAAFHTIVLLARPLGGREGMLFHSSMVNSSGIFNNGSNSGKNGIAVMLDSMRRFESADALQAMSCWSLVNIALAPSQKAVLVKLGGISATANAMMQHPYSAEVQFRALFALINLVIPSVSLSEETNETTRSVLAQLGDVNDLTEKEMLDENVGQIANLVVLAMKNFCSSQTILNRACLVLHNLSLTNDYHTTLLWTPNCYQMLEWCLANYPRDQVLQQSAAGTLHRLQLTLSSDDVLRTRFTASIQAQQQLSLEQAHREATMLHGQEEQQSQQ